MGTSNVIITLILPLCLAVIYSLLLVRGEMCGVITRAAPYEDCTALRDKTFSAFKAECRMKKKDKPMETKNCSFITEPSTPHSFKFILEPVSMPFILNFNVKAERDGMVALAEEKTDGSIFAEINIGGWENTKSVIRSCRSDACTEVLVQHSEAGLLNAMESRPFWISYNEGIIRVGNGGQTIGFLEWNAGEYHGRVPTQVHVGISTWQVARGYWVFNQFCG